MKSIIIVLFIFCCSVANAQLIPNTSKKSVSIVTLEVSNKDWEVFLNFIKKDPLFSKSFVQSMIPDQWRSTTINSQDKNQAVTGVSWQQAMEYCNWKSELSTYLNSHTKLTTYQQMQIDNKTAKTRITYRLPTEKEFVSFAAKGGTGFRCVYSVKNAS